MSNMVRMHALLRSQIAPTKTEVESRTQGSRPRTQKNPRPRTALSRTEPLEAKERNARGQGRGPRTQAQMFSKKKDLQKCFFRRSPKEKNKKGLRKFSARFLAFPNKILMVQKIMLSSSRGQGNFRRLEASRPRPRT